MNDTGYFPYTPPTQLLHGLRRALDRINAEGLDNVIARHRPPGRRRAARRCRLGPGSCAPSIPSLYSNTVTAIRVPEGVDARDVIRIGYERYNTSFGSGLARLAGKVFRIGHLGDLNEGMCLTALAVAEMALVEAGAEDRARLRRRGSAALVCRRPRRNRSRAARSRITRQDRQMSHTLYPLRKQRLQRSELAVPASNPTMIDKAADGPADYVFLDLEDAVAPPEKEQARKNASRR